MATEDGGPDKRRHRRKPTDQTSLTDNETNNEKNVPLHIWKPLGRIGVYFKFKKRTKKEQSEFLKNHNLGEYDEYDDDIEA